MLWKCYLTMILLVIIISSLFLFTGCPGPAPRTSNPQQPIVITLANDQDRHVDEGHYYVYGNPIVIEKAGQIDVYFNLKEWDEDYRIEVIFLSDDEFEHFKRGETFWSIKHIPALYQGTYEVSFAVSPGIYCLIVDNSDLGYEDTDWDGVNDDAVYDLIVTYTYY